MFNMLNIRQNVLLLINFKCISKLFCEIVPKKIAQVGIEISAKSFFSFFASKFCSFHENNKQRSDSEKN